MKSKEEIDKMMETAEGIAIYGAGVVAQNAYLLVNQLLKKEFRGFLVSHYDSSDSKIKMTDAMYHKPIREIEEADINAETLVIIAVSERYRKEIERKMEKRGHQKTVFLSSELRNYLFSQYYREYFEKLGIDLAEKWIRIGNYMRVEGGGREK